MPQGVPVVPQDQNGARFYGKLRRQQQNNWPFPASTTTPFSGNTPAGVRVWDAALSYAATQGATPTGEFELAEIHGVQLILANNNSGQTLSGITLTDWDEAPSSGLAIPGQSYTTAINLATGASVTLSALNLASGSAIRLWVPINSASLRFLVVNPTYAAAVTAGTGSLETIAIPEYGTVQLSGSLALLPSPGQKDLIGGSSGNPAVTIAAGATYTSTVLNYLGNRKASAYFSDAGASTSPNYVLSIYCLATGKYGGYINSASTSTTIGYSYAGPIDIVTSGIYVTVQNNNTTNTLSIYQLSLGVQ